MATPPPPNFYFSAPKAGMEDVDAARIARIIEEHSKDNPYYLKFARTDQRTRERAMRLREAAAALTAKDLRVAQIEVDKRVAALEAERNLSRTVVCVDLDMFFAACEMRDDPSLRGKPVAVGRTLISTANYDARKYGVRSAMPTFLGRKLCPHLVVVPGRYQVYGEASQRAKEVFLEYDANFSAMSLDEAYLDLTHLMQGLTLASAEGRELAGRFVSEMRAKVTQNTRGLTCSAGIAPLPMLAKIASERNKPNGQFVVDANRDSVLEFVRTLSVRKIPGIGKASELTLSTAFDIKTVQDLFDKRYVLNRVCTPAIVDFWLRVSLAAKSSGGEGGFFGTGGMDGEGNDESHRNVGNDDDHDDDEDDGSGRKSISIERTFSHSRDPARLKAVCLHVCNELAREIVEKNVWGKTLTLKVKDDHFESKTRSLSHSSAFGGTKVTGAFLFSLVEPMLRRELPASLRLIGVRLSGFCDENINFDGRVLREQDITKFLKTTNAPFSSTSSSSSSSSASSSSLPAQPVPPHAAAAECPICGLSRADFSDNQVLNEHVDLCLNRDVVGVPSGAGRDVVEEPGKPRKKTKSGILDYFSTSSSFPPSPEPKRWRDGEDEDDLQIID